MQPFPGRRIPKIVRRTLDPVPLPSLSDPILSLPLIWQGVIRWLDEWCFDGDQQMDDTNAFHVVAVILRMAADDVIKQAHEPIVRAVLRCVTHGADSWSEENFEEFGDLISTLKGDKIAREMLASSSYESRDRIMLHALAHHLLVAD